MTSAATAVALSLSVLAGCETAGQPGHCPHTDPDILRQMFEQAQRSAASESARIGYVIPWEAAWVTGQAESNWHNYERGCEGGVPSGRSGGFFSITAPVVERCGRQLGLTVPRRREYIVPDDWAKASCHWLHGHPISQVRIFFRLMANLIASEHGSLPQAWADYGPPEARFDYQFLLRRIWQRQRFDWPANGQLAKR